jgi:hypothetical protein
MSEEAQGFNKLREDWERATEAMFQAMPQDYDGLTRSLSHADYSFRLAVARRLGPALNDHITNSGYGTYRSNKRLSSWINAEAAQFGLAILCPEANRPSMLIAEHDNRRPRGLGHFGFQHRSDFSQTGYERTSYVNILPPLTFVPTALDAPEWTRWDNLPKQRSTEGGRGR